jgi:prepilin-type N-terminal cleavage/methylation domain-containing protein
MKRHHTPGFSLVELSIVLVILGLLTGGIMTARSLIHAASVRGTMAQMNDMTRNMNVFRDKYFAFPGDMSNAQRFWPTASNGNADGIISAATHTNSHQLYEADNGRFNGERAQLFIQLGLANMTTAYDGSAVLDKGYPSIKLNRNAGMMVVGPWMEASGSNMNVHLIALDPVYLYMGICNPSQFNVSSSHNDCGVFSPEDAWNIDKKMDDGLPLSGVIIGQSFDTPCVQSAAYNLDHSPLACNILYSID